MQQATLGFIGLGNLGGRITHRLGDAGYSVPGYYRGTANVKD